MVGPSAALLSHLRHQRFALVMVSRYPRARLRLTIWTQESLRRELALVESRLRALASEIISGGC